MKTIEKQMRAEYQRSDFGRLERGEFLKEVTHQAPSALLESQLAKGLPTSEVVPDPLRVPSASDGESAPGVGRAKRRSKKRSAE
jgi:hypothetical protein